ncbi:MAG: cell division protein FtsK [Pyrinomonadaceae bacterium]|nr:cell division protein FtsK [Phycisphaerales bacterium]
MDTKSSLPHSSPREQSQPQPAPPPASPRQRELLREVHRLVSERVQAETAAQRALKSTTATVERELAEGMDVASTELSSRNKAADAEYEVAVARIAEEFESGRVRAKQDTDVIRHQVGSRLDAEERSATKVLKEKIWAAETIYEANQGKPDLEFEQTKKTIQTKLNDLVATETTAGSLLHLYKQPMTEADIAAAGADMQPPQESEPSLEFDRRAEAATRLTQRLSRLALPRMRRSGSMIVLALMFVAGVTLLVAWTQQWKFDAMVGVVGGSSVIFAATAVWGLSRAARNQVTRVRLPLIEAIVAAHAATERWLQLAGTRRESHARALVEQRDAEVLRAKEKHEPVILAVRQRRAEETSKLQEQYTLKRAAIDKKREEDSAVATDARRKSIASARKAFEAATSHHRNRHEEITRAAAERSSAEWNRLETDWKSGMARVHSGIESVRESVQDVYRPWTDPAWRTWEPRQRNAPAMAFGDLIVDLARIPGGIPADPRLALPMPSTLRIPATIALPDECSLFLKHTGEGRDQALGLIRATMLRLLTSLPPGKARFTIFDPVGLGQNFAGFMRLADDDEALVGGKIWTEQRHIEQRLTDLTEHMENVIQKYLRNEFRTITEYNLQAGEIAEPYRFLVIADFPAGFSENSMARLASVITSGARCGVHTLIAMDTRQSLPASAPLSDLQRTSVRLEWKRPIDAPSSQPSTAAPPLPRKAAGSSPGSSAAPIASPPQPGAFSSPPRFVWDDPDFAAVPMELDALPDEDLFNDILHKVGVGAKNSSRVQVPFETIAPGDDEFWTMDSGEELRVPLGRAGATKLQYMSLGRGTSQHMLVAGKTGSGKSNLLNTIVTNLSMWYSPDQVQFYLVDFKKGVEFKGYATHELPHARAVAIESDREFGLSVLMRLDAELKRRGNLYRDLGVQDLRGFRARRPDEPMPRVLLIIDEFQEFFTEDDKLSQDATLLLDRLVRQGRAFGMHVILGSQTLSGAYSLARSTMGQMAVRVALQCSEADSYVILSEDNAAARLLSRPGEAIYNDSSGMVEGNSPFQVAWLPDDHRDTFLSRVSAFAKRNHYRVSERQAVFEGNVPADLARNLLLSELLDNQRSGKPPARSPAVLKAWLGDAIAIKDPTAAILRKQTGSNLVIVGQREETSLAMLSCAMIGLSAQLPPWVARRSPPDSPGGNEHENGRTPRPATFYVLDPTPSDSLYADHFARVAARLPQTTRLVSYREVESALSELHAQLNARRDAGDPAAAAASAATFAAHNADADADARSGPASFEPIFLIINGIQKYRQLRKADDDFSFSMDADKPPSPDKLLAEILREGPSVGMHVLLWCDTASNLTRALDRQGLREFDYRALMQMSATDSAALIDSPDAGKLGLHRALLHSEEQGVSEKFRPYAVPTEAWLHVAHDSGAV